MFPHKFLKMLAAAWILLFGVLFSIVPAYASTMTETLTVDGITATVGNVIADGVSVWVTNSAQLEMCGWTSWRTTTYPGTSFYLNLLFFDGSVASMPLPMIGSSPSSTDATSLPWPSGWSGATSEALTNSAIAFISEGAPGISNAQLPGIVLLPPPGTAYVTYYDPTANPLANDVYSGSTTATTSSTSTTGTTTTSGITSGTSAASSVNWVSGGTGCNPQSVSTGSTPSTSSATGITVTSITTSSPTMSSSEVFTVTGNNLPILNSTNGVSAPKGGLDFSNVYFASPNGVWVAGTTGAGLGLNVIQSTSTSLQFTVHNPGYENNIYELFLSPDGTNITAQGLLASINVPTGVYTVAVTEAPTINVLPNSISPTSLILTWNSVPNATGYTVMENGNPLPIQPVIDGNQVSVSITSLTPGSTYYFQVQGTNSLSNGPQSNVQEIFTPLAPPSNLQAINFTQSSFDLTWNAESNALGYEVFQNGVQIATATTNSYTVTGLAAGNYSFYVEAIDSCGDITNPSNVVQVTLNSPQSPIASVQASGTTGSSGTVTWTTGSSSPAGTTYQVTQNGQPIGTTTGSSYPVSNYDAGSTYGVSAVTPPPTGITVTVLPGSGTSGVTGTVGTSGGSIACAGTTISWTPGVGTPAGTVYTVEDNGTPVGTTTNTSLSVPNCNANDSFTVSAQGSGYLSSSVLSGSGSVSGTTCNCTCPTPPDWTQIAQQIGNEVWAQMPPIPSPPVGSDLIPTSDAVPITAPDSLSTLGSFSSPSFTEPSSFAGQPSFSLPASNASINFTTGYTSIPVPTSGSIAFSIADPNQMPHQAPGVIPIIGSGVTVGFTPSAPTIDNSTPLPNVQAPTSGNGPAYSSNTSLLGTMPAWSDPSGFSSAGPTPSYTASGGGVPPLPSAYTAITPSYSAGTTTGAIPIWSG